MTMIVYARIPTDATPAGFLTAGKMYQVERDARDGSFQISDDLGDTRLCLWRGCGFLHGGDWDRVETYESCAASTPAPGLTPNLSDILHDLLRLHIAHHNHPVHARARAALAEIADPVE